tara:strand:- start:1988 stop:2269 length:282 start_codon:yes stop_codon:yes gene_type:complete
MKKILFNRKAAQELLDATRYYGNESIGLGSEFSQEIQRALLLITRYPKIGLTIRHNMRRFVLARFPYYIIYRILSDGYIRILAIAHQKQKPRY